MNTEAGSAAQHTYIRCRVASASQSAHFYPSHRLLLTTEALIVEKKEEKGAPAGGPPGGMGGMY
jgi:hypothetical protein